MQLAFVLYKYFPLDRGLPAHRHLVDERIPGLHPGYVITEPV